MALAVHGGKCHGDSRLYLTPCVVRREQGIGIRAKAVSNSALLDC